MFERKFVLYLAGASCTGKTTIEKILMSSLENVYSVSYDKIKWQLSNYHRDLHKEIIKDLVKDFFVIICKKKLSIILLPVIVSDSEYAWFHDTAQNAGYAFLCVELTAPQDVLLNRFRERVKNARDMGTKISVTDEQLFLQNNRKQIPLPEGIPTFDTSVLTPEVISDQIKKLIS